MKLNEKENTKLSENIKDINKENNKNTTYLNTLQNSVDVLIKQIEEKDIK